MRNVRTTYSLKGIFSNLLEDSETHQFNIPSYQRGYKWTSVDENEIPDVDSQVYRLISDFYKAYKARKSPTYLHFITLKKDNDLLEVIDGQQRLTTIVLIISLFHKYLDIQENCFVKGKLEYETRSNFIQECVYNNIESILDVENWESFIDIEFDFDPNNQDVYHLFHAIRTVNSFISELNLDDRELDSFYKYVCSNIFLIVNTLGEDINSERIFINVNKGVKLNDEDLVKALLITKIPLEKKEYSFRISEIEINEIRANIGRQWDELNKWASKEEIITFFKRKSEYGSKLSWLLHLTFPDIANSQGRNKIFDYLDRLLNEKTINAAQTFEKIRTDKLVLDDWYRDAEVSNLLGYLIHSKSNIQFEDIWRETKKQSSKSDFLNSLKEQTKNILPLNEDATILDLDYEKPRDKDKLFNLFLILEIAKFILVSKKEIRKYDFSDIAEGTWSMEHIFPQNPKELTALKSLSNPEIEILREIVPSKFDSINLNENLNQERSIELHYQIFNEDGEIPISPDDREIIAAFLQSSGSELHEIGNLALLLKNTNSALSNRYFDSKRRTLVKRISDGEFIPYHTYDVFSKLIISNSTSLYVWSKADMSAHKAFIETKISEISKYLAS